MYSPLNLCIDNLRCCNIEFMIVSILLSAGILAENYAISIMICAQTNLKTALCIFFVKIEIIYTFTIIQFLP